ncbi:hypothetical protein ACHQM5_001828 [Ranunculus cassubicifolius]
MNAFYVVDDYLIIFSPFHSKLQVEEQQTLSYILPILFILISIFLIILISISLHKKFNNRKQIADPNFTINETKSKPYSLFLEILNSNPPIKLEIINPEEDSVNEELVEGDCGKSVKKKKKRSKKTRGNGDGKGMSVEGDKHCVYPFTSLSSATQRKIKQQYDQLVKSNVSKGLTITQVGEFVNCLVEARNVLQHKSEVIQRKFTITKALLLKADRSSFDRLSQQLYKLEAEQKRLEEDANVYNRLQQQLKLSPAYKKMLEIGARMELKASSDQLTDKEDTELPDISFEELLAREKKDTFWQKNGKMRSCMNS